MKTTRRSALKLLGAALLAPLMILLPKRKRSGASERLTYRGIPIYFSDELGGDEVAYRFRLEGEGLVFEKEFTTGEVIELSRGPLVQAAPMPVVKCQLDTTKPESDPGCVEFNRLA